MPFAGELISLFVAVSWTVTALFAEVGSKRMGSLPLNIVRMTMSLTLLVLTLWLIMGQPWPRYADVATWLWLLVSGVVGYVIGDYCLMQGYIYIGSRMGQLFMTLSAPTAALTGWLLLGEQMRPLALLGMVVTLSGIAMSIISGRQPAPNSQQPSQTSNSLPFQPFKRSEPLKPFKRSEPLKPFKRSEPFQPFQLSLPPKGIFFAAMAGICQGGGLVLSKIGLQHYDASLAQQGIDATAALEGALIPVPVFLAVPFAATMIRATMGLVGFVALHFLFDKHASSKLAKAVHDRKAMWCVFGATVFGPFIGVSASLLATQYTSTGIAQTLFALTPVLIIAPAALIFKQKVRLREVIGAVVSVCGVCFFFM